MIWQQYFMIVAAVLGFIGAVGQDTVASRIITATLIVFGQYVLYSGGWYNVH